MLNAEKYKKEILKLEKKRVLFAFSTEEGKVKPCESTKCKDCVFYTNKIPCDAERIKWLLSEYKEPILDEVEREYLKRVCAPYEVVNITKYYDDRTETEFIHIIVTHFSGIRTNSIVLPDFKAKTMYKGMKVNKHYTPQQLGINCKNSPKGGN